MYIYLLERGYRGGYGVSLKREWVWGVGVFLFLFWVPTQIKKGSSIGSEKVGLEL